MPRVVDDARRHPLVAENLAIDVLGVVAYLGAPVRSNGVAVGALCAISDAPRWWSAADVATMESLAACVTEAISLKALVLVGEELRQEQADFTFCLAEMVSSPSEELSSIMAALRRAIADVDGAEATALVRAGEAVTTHLGSLLDAVLDFFHCVWAEVTLEDIPWTPSSATCSMSWR